MKRQSGEQRRNDQSAAMRVPMGWGVSALFFLAAVSGYYLIADRSWGLLLRAAAYAHPAAGIAATVWLYVFTLKKARMQDMHNAVRRLLFRPFAAMAVLLVPAVLKPSMMGASSVWFSTIAVFIVSASQLRMPRREADTGRIRYYFFTGGLIWAIWLALTYTGLAALVMFMRSNITLAVRVHGWISYGMLALFIAHLYAVRPLLGHEVRAATPVGRPPHIGILASAIIIAAAFSFSLAIRGAEWKVPLSTYTLERRPAPERQWPPSAPVSDAELEKLDVSGSCGNGSGCHGDLLSEHFRSAHNITVKPKYFQVNLHDMAKETGARNQVICAGCHYPTGALDRRKDASYYRTHDNFSCVFCHSISGAGIDASDPKKSWYVVSPPWRHMKMFPDGRTASVSKADRILIRLNAMGHRRAFKRALHSDDVYCSSCHHQQMPPLVTLGLKNPKCILCHMQPQEIFGGRTRLKSHLFAGANPGPALLTGDMKTADVIRRWAGGRIVPRLKGWETMWGVRRSETEAVTRVPWIMITFFNDAPPQPGRDFSIEIYSTNTGLAHHFPSASLDLAKAWLEFEARTERGRVFCSRGKAAIDGPIPKDTAVLGGYMVGRDGKIVMRNRVWQVAKKVIQRRIMNLEEIHDTITCRVPDDAGREITLSAKWNYRKLDQDFLDYAYGKGMVAIPPVVVGETSNTIPVGRGGGHYQ